MLGIRTRGRWGTRVSAGLGAGIAAAVVAAVVVAPVTAAPRARAAAAPGCSTSQLVVWIDTNGNGSLGHVDYNIHFTNLGSHACTLRGFPGVSAVGLRRHQVGDAANRDHGVPVRTIRLHGNGGGALADLHLTDVGVFPNALCHQQLAAGLRVFPPNSTRSKTIPFPVDACAKKGTTYMLIRAVQKLP